MAKSDLRIDILGTSITISTDETPEYLNELLSKYRERIENLQRISGLKDPLKVAILTGFLLCDDLEKAGTVITGEKEGGELERLTLGMITRLDEALGEKDLPRERNDIKEETSREVLSHEVPALEDPAAPPVHAPPLPCACTREEIQSNSNSPKAFYRLQNVVKNYQWGSTEWIPALLGQKNMSRLPWAELWMGVHPDGPSQVILPDGGNILLPELIGSDPEAFLGRETAKKFGKLPFLFKVEAAAKPLSIQAHPNLEQAREGFERENSEGIPIDAPNRNYKDPNHKPEIFCALSPFAALCGFRDANSISMFMDILFSNSDGVLKNSFECLFFALSQGAPAGATGQTSPPAEENSLKAFLTALSGLGAEAREAIGPFLRSMQPQLEKIYPEYRDEWNLCSYLSGLYPGDIGVFAPLYLNIIQLEPGEAIYIPSGIPHAYIHGFGMELMSDSDNVLRGGLSSKYMDMAELLRVLDFSGYKPEILKVPEPVPAVYTYPAPAGEFALSVIRGSGAAVPYMEEKASIVMVTEGEVILAEPGAGAGKPAALPLAKGESIFIPAGKHLVFGGTFTAYAAAALCKFS